MTSASELFHSRRSRFGVRSSTIDDPGLDSSLADANSLISHHHRSTTTSTSRRHLHQYPHSSRRDRHDLDGCDPPIRRIHRHRFAISEQEQARTEQSGIQPPSRSMVNAEDLRDAGGGRRATGNDRLPGAVLRARERLLERLRGVSVSGNRQRSRASSSVHQEDFSNSGSSGFIEPDNYFLEISDDWQEEFSVMPMSWRAVMPMLSTSEETAGKRPPGLAQDSLKCLPLEVFRTDKNDVESETSVATRECTICLEGFQDGDELITLPCMHRFHSGCLLPWVQVCGACPNCRNPIVVPDNKPVT